ncbi:MAG: type II secretion system protein GspN [Nitrospirae bacterium]|nr:type II secretion system protein GspN [Nitrospirota bacterium]MBI3594536.1 type II secretion system protein GspN [Nitrospirota bacterium]
MKMEMTWVSDRKRLILSIAGLVLYGLAVYLIFLILNFPKEKVQRWFFIQFQKAIESELTVGETRFVFPLGTEWKQITILPYGKKEPRFVMDRLNVDFLVTSLLFKKSLDARFNLKSWGGEIRGVVAAERGGGASRYSVTAEGEEIDLKKFPWEKGITVEGKIRFQTEYRWEERDPAKGKGFLNIEGNGINGKGLSFSGFSLPELTIYKLTGHGVIREGSLMLDRLNSTGSLADLNGSGTVLIEFPLERSLLNISMKFTPKEALNKVIPLAFLSPHARTGFPMELFLKGTLKEPVFTLTGTPS